MNLLHVLVAFALVGLTCAALVWIFSKPLREIP